MANPEARVTAIGANRKPYRPHWKVLAATRHSQTPELGSEQIAKRDHLLLQSPVVLR